MKQYYFMAVERGYVTLLFITDLLLAMVKV